MKKKIFFSFLLVFLVLLSVTAFAEDTANITLNMDVYQYRFTKYSQAMITLDVDGKVYTETFIITRDAKNIKAEFKVDNLTPESEVKIRGEYGFCGFGVNDEYIEAGNTFTQIPVVSEDGNYNINLTLYPYYYKNVDFFIDYAYTEFTDYVILSEDSYAFVPIIELAKALGIEDAAYFAEYNCVKLTVGDTEMVYFIDSKKYTVNGEEFEADCNTAFVGSTIYAQLRPFADVFDVEVGFTDEGDKYNINVGESKVAKKYNGKAHIMNERGIKSDTEYLIWVSKSEFTVRVFKGSQGNWEFVDSFLCAIGAPGTPTCEGTFKYYQYQKMWPYANYYCGPVMRFNGGYAMHSTLLRYNGVPYDNRVGVRISHGCVRLRANDINWLAANIPLYTTVYITA